MNHYDAEVNQFSKMAQSWWDPMGPCRPLHLLNPVRTAFIQEHLDCHQSHILDVGCGGGLLAETLTRAGGKVIALDKSEDLIAVAREHAQAHHLEIDYQVADLETFASTHVNTFDAITCLELLEHVPDPERLIQDCLTCLKPGGRLFFSTLDRSFKSFLMSIVGAEYILRWLPKGTHDYSHFIRPSELNDVLMRHGAHLVALSGIQLNPITSSVRLTSSIDANYIAVFEKSGAQT